MKRRSFFALFAIAPAAIARQSADGEVSAPRNYDAHIESGTLPAARQDYDISDGRWFTLTPDSIESTSSAEVTLDRFCPLCGERHTVTLYRISGCDTGQDHPGPNDSTCTEDRMPGKLVTRLTDQLMRCKRCSVAFYVGGDE